MPTSAGLGNKSFYSYGSFLILCINICNITKKEFKKQNSYTDTWTNAGCVWGKSYEFH